MGCVLSAPVELTRVQRSGGPHFRCAVAEMQGWRVNHEDAHEIKCEGANGAFLVLDGHGGDQASAVGAPTLLQELCEASAGGENGIASDDRLVKAFSDVDERLREHFNRNPDKESGTTVVGAAVAHQNDGTYRVKLLNCGDSRGIIVRGPTEEEATATDVTVRTPEHLLSVKRDSQHYPVVKWPIACESVDHKPNHPTEKARIEAAGGSVSEEEPPRLDSNLAVSRGLGDFEYKCDKDRPPRTQKVSNEPDIYDVQGLRQGSLCILCCDGVWDVMSGSNVADYVRSKLQEEPNADLGDLAAEIINLCLEKNSRDNITVMIVHFVDGSDWANGSMPDEMKNYEKLQSSDLDEEVQKQYQNFLKRCKFDKKPLICGVCERWTLNMFMCPCKQVYYCTKKCQKKGWKAHKNICPNAPPTTPGGKPASTTASSAAQAAPKR